MRINDTWLKICSVLSLLGLVVPSILVLSNPYVIPTFLINLVIGPVLMVLNGEINRSDYEESQL